ncbi:MAG: type III secretion system stator protein SctL [bacterium]|nr:type III secretion system stator protein SctL [bacterium]MCS7308825.1 type III secretion system stator protein SctL [Armatimonadota bacterium]MDW8103769.1 type III secretion system stator protein SctL [Armatimonadota bacterium]
MRMQVLKADQLSQLTRWVGAPLRVVETTDSPQEEPEPATPTPDELIAEAKRVLAEAHRQADQMRQDAVRRGYEEGLQIGREEGMRYYQQQVEALRDQVQKLVNALLAERQRLWEEMEPQVIDLVLDIARKVLREEIQARREATLSIIKHALRRVTDTEHVRIRVHPDDLQIAREHREAFLAVCDGVKQMEIVDDQRVGGGGCIIETPSGTIDASLRTQMQCIERALCEGEQAA